MAKLTGFGAAKAEHGAVHGAHDRVLLAARHMDHVAIPQLLQRYRRKLIAAAAQAELAIAVAAPPEENAAHTQTEAVAPAGAHVTNRQQPQRSHLVRHTDEADVAAAKAELAEAVAAPGEDTTVFSEGEHVSFAACDPFQTESIKRGNELDAGE